MLLRLGFDQCCEIVGRASAIITIAGMASLVSQQQRLTFCAKRPDIDVGLRSMA
jgi:hypothetical protein